MAEVDVSSWELRLKLFGHYDRWAAEAAAVSLAPDEAAILLHPPPLPLVGVSIGMERERRWNDSLVNG